MAGGGEVDDFDSNSCFGNVQKICWGTKWSMLRMRNSSSHFMQIFHVSPQGRNINAMFIASSPFALYFQNLLP